MKIIIPMSGMGQRFVDVGYVAPKPLLVVGGKMIIEHILDMFDRENDDFVFIVNKKHVWEHSIDKVVEKLVRKSNVISIDPHKYGPVYAVQAAYDYIEDCEQVIVSYCDNPYLWDYSHFKKYVEEEKLDGCIMTHTGFHPHRLATTRMAYLKLGDDGLMQEIKEKESYTDDHWSEHGSTGTYYFKTGNHVKHYFDMCVEKNINYNGEYYVTLVYNLLVNDGLRVKKYDTDFAMVFGTPREVEHFNAWETLILGAQVKDEDSLLKSYRYWKEYNEKQGNLC